MGLLNLIYHGLTKYAKSDKVPPHSTGYGSTRISKFEPNLMELCRSSRLFVAAMSIAADGTAPGQTLPTTSAQHIFYNNSPGKYLVPLRLGFYNCTATAGTAGQSLWAGVTPLPLATPITGNTTGCTVGSLRGATAGNVAFYTLAGTVPTMQANYVLLGGVETVAETTVGCGAAFDTQGMFIVPYGYALAAAVLSGAGNTPIFGVSCTFALLELDLEG